MNFLKRFLFKIFGVERYLNLVSKLFFLTYYLNLLKRKSEFSCHYFVRNLIKNGDSIIDLGANLGYYTLIFSKLTGETGRVFAIEPVQLFRKVMKKNLGKRTNVVILPYAVGSPDHQPIQMGVPATTAYFSHGRTHVLSEKEEAAITFKATLMTPDTLFHDLQKLDYFKCDIEGYEGVAIPLFETIFRKFRPLVQIEIDSDNLERLDLFFRDMDYRFFLLVNHKLQHRSHLEKGNNGDWLLIPSEKVSLHSDLIENTIISLILGQF